MKIARLFLGLLIGSLFVVSCHKQEGQIIDPWETTNNVGFSQCSIVGNVDYAVYNVSLNLQSLTQDSIQVERVELKYWADGLGTSDTVTLKLLEDETLAMQETPLLMHDTLWKKISPKTRYSYQLVMTDGFIMHEVVEGQFETVNPAPSVKIDNAYLSNGKYYCEATVGAFRRALLDDAETPYELRLYYGESEDDVENSVELSDEITKEVKPETDSLYLHFSGSIMNQGIVNLWFKAYVKDSWGNEVYSEPFAFGRDPISQIMSEPDMAQAENGIVRVSGKASMGAEELTLYQCGFCYGLNESPTLDDQVVLVDSPQWGRIYQCQLNNLQPGATYHCRSFLKVTDENGAVYYSTENKTFTMPAAALPVDVEVVEEIENALLNGYGLYATIGSVTGDESLVAERGFVWRIKVEGEDTPVTFDNADGSAPGYKKTEIPQEYSMYLTLAGVNLSDDQFVTIMSGLEIETLYTCRAYIKLTDETVLYSEGTLEVKTLSE